LRNHSATWPHGGGSIQSIKDLGNHPRSAWLKVLKLEFRRVSETRAPGVNSKGVTQIT
jgi:hypothetical protein